MSVIDLTQGASAPGVNKQTITLVIPMFNEERRIGESLGALFEYIALQPSGSCLLFVDDGSTDRTLEILSTYIALQPPDRARILRCPHRGKGATVREGLLAATTDLAGFCDVDLATPLEEMARLLAASAAGSCLAIGSREAEGAAIQQHEERRRELAGKAFNKAVRLWLCPGVQDTQCGAKAAPTKVWREILRHSKENGFAIDVELIATSLRVGVPVQEIGVRWNHDDRTTVHVFRDGVSMVLSLPRIGFRIRRAYKRDSAIDLTASPAASRANLAKSG